jgi:hypothetical protein
VAQCDAVLRDEAASAIPDLAWRAAFGRGRALESLGRLDQALADYLRAVDIIERVRAQLSAERARTGFLDDKRECMPRLFGCCCAWAAQGSLPGRRTFARRRLSRNGRARLALGASQGAGLGQPAGAHPAPAGGDGRGAAASGGGTARAGRHRVSDELREAEDAWSAAVSALTGARAACGCDCGPATEVSVAGVQQWLPARSALLEYVVDRDRTTAFVLRAVRCAHGCCPSARWS